MDGTYDEWLDQGCRSPDDPKPKSDPEEDGLIWFIDEDDIYGLKLGDQYFSEKTGQVFTLIGASDPARWDDNSDRILRCQESQMDGYARAKVRSADGSETVILPGLLQYFATEEIHLSSPPMRFLDYNQMLNMPEPEWLIEGVIQKQTSAMIFGASNAFKSFLGIDLMMCAATGRDWHGHAVKCAVPCVYVATEGSRGVAGQRVPGWGQHHGVPDDCRDNFLVCGEEVALDDPTSVKNLIETCKYWKSLRAIRRGEQVGKQSNSDAVGLIVIDIFGASMLGSESSDETARAWVKSVNYIMEEMQCAVLTIAHTGWADDTRARMHSHFWGSFDTRLKAVGDKESLTTVLSVDRHKDADSEGQWGFRLDKVDAPRGQTTLVPRLCDEVETTQKRRVSGKPAIALQALSEALIDQGRAIAGPHYPTCPVVTLSNWRAMCERHGLSDSDNSAAQKKAFQRAKTALLTKGLIKQFDDNVWKVSADE